LIDAEGGQVGIVDIAQALQQAEEVGLDLVEIAPNVSPPVCRIMDYGKYLFEQSKRHKKKTRQIQVKEIKLRPVTEVGDYTVKVRKAIEFLKGGDKVKFTVKFRGREIAYQRMGMEMLQRAEADLKEYGTIEQPPRVEGRQMVMLVVPARHQK
jgi:translation initiation factor IF-3